MRKSSLFAAFILMALFYAQVTAQQIITVRPQQIDSVLYNPGIGFNSSQHLDIRRSTDGHYRLNDPQLPEAKYPRPSHAYLRFDWRYFEPERGKFNWYIIDDALKLAVERGQRLAFRVVPYGSNPREDIPDWLRAEIGVSDSLTLLHSFWRVTHSEPQYIKAITDMVTAVGARYDGNPDIEYVDVGIVGFWGEGAGTGLLPQETRIQLVDAYLNAFRKTQLVFLLTDNRTLKYALSRADVGWRKDCLGDLGFWAREQDGFFHMADNYPQAIAGFEGVNRAWEKAPVVFEICGVFNTWKNREHYDSTQVAYIFDQALKWHISMFNAKSGEVPPEWRPMVDEWLKKMGYRLALRKFTYPHMVHPQGKLAFTSWWENQGVAPCYRNYPVALRLVGEKRTELFVTDSDIRKWLPGDALFDSSVFVPLDMPEGEYELQLGIVDPLTHKPLVKLAIAGRTPESWYPLGKIQVRKPAVDSPPAGL